jgi:membrane fusion protein (multidrug efflux system)
VVVGPIGIDDMEAFLDASATLEAERAVDVVSEATGVVAQLTAEEGDPVRKDATLARLAYESLELAEARALSEYQRLQNEFARAEKLSGERFISEEEFQRIRFDLKRAEIDWQTARLELDRTRIAAPIAGTVVERYINVGQLVRQNDPLFRVVDFDSLIAPVFVPEKHLPDLHVGQEAFVATPGLGGRRVTGSVLRISPVVDSQSGTVRVVVDLPSSDALRPGMFANVQLVLDAHRDAVVVSKKALVYEDESPHVFVVEDGVAKRRPVSIGYQDASRAEITDGLERGEFVVLVGQSTLKDGSAVVAEDESGAPVDVGGAVASGPAAAEDASAPRAKGKRPAGSTDSVP